MENARKNTGSVVCSFDHCITLTKEVRAEVYCRWEVGHKLVRDPQSKAFIGWLSQGGRPSMAAAVSSVMGKPQSS